MIEEKKDDMIIIDLFLFEVNSKEAQLRSNQFDIITKSILNDNYCFV